MYTVNKQKLINISVNSNSFAISLGASKEVLPSFHPRQCDDIKQYNASAVNGIYTIYPKLNSTEYKLEVCFMICEILI